MNKGAILALIVVGILGVGTAVSVRLAQQQTQLKSEASEEACPGPGDPRNKTTCGTETYNVCLDDTGINSTDSRFCQNPNSKFSCSFSGNHNCNSGFIYSCSTCPSSGGGSSPTPPPYGYPSPSTYGYPSPSTGNVGVGGCSVTPQDVSSWRSCTKEQLLSKLPGSQLANLPNDALLDFGTGVLMERIPLSRLATFPHSRLNTFDNTSLEAIGRAKGDLGDFLKGFPVERLYGGPGYEGQSFSSGTLALLPCSTIAQMPIHIQTQIPKDCSGQGGTTGGTPTGVVTPTPTSTDPGTGGPAAGSVCSYKILDRATLTDAVSVEGGKPYIFRITMTNKESSVWNVNYKLQALDNTQGDWGLSKDSFKISDPESKRKQEVAKDASVTFDIPAQSQVTTEVKSLAFNFKMATDQGTPFGAACEPQDIVVSPPSVRTACYAISEDENLINNINDCSDPNTQPYTTHPLKVNFTLDPANQAAGPRRVFAKFFPVSGAPATFSRIITYSPAPTLTQVTCTQSATGTGTLFVLSGNNLGAHLDQGSSGVKVKGVAATITEWNEAGGFIYANVGEKLDGEIPVEVTTSDGRVAKGRCTVGATNVVITAKMQCRADGQYSASDVELKIFENSPAADPKQPLISQKVTLDKDGMVQGFSPKVEKGKGYVVIVKAPGTLARKAEFIAESGTKILEPIELPVGDLAKDTGAVSKVNAFDKSRLISQWNAVTDVTRPCDFNLDGRCNTFDYSCMRKNINKEDDVFTPPTFTSPQQTIDDDRRFLQGSDSASPSGQSI